MRLISWNVNGIRAVSKKEIFGSMTFMEWLAEESPDALCLQETKAWPEQLKKDLLEPAGYHSFWNQAEKKGYSGTCIYTREKPIASSTGMGLEELDKEGRIVSVEFPEFTLLNIYFPNGNQNEQRLKYKLDFYDAFLDHINALRESGQKVIFCGDINTAHHPIDLSRPKENEHVSGFLRIERDWLDKLEDEDYIDTFRHFCKEPENYSWWDYKTRARERNVGWRLDYFWVSDDLLPKLKKAFIMSDIVGSDHCPVAIDIDL